MARNDDGYVKETVKCPHCRGQRTFVTVSAHPKGAGHTVPCSRCKGEGTIEVRREVEPDDDSD